MPAIPPKFPLPPAPAAAQPETAPQTQELAPEDSYYDGPYLVFTAAYHLKRGYCCESGCRHCPYRDSA
jgi:hypothetical protein